MTFKRSFLTKLQVKIVLQVRKIDFENLLKIYKFSSDIVNLLLYSLKRFLVAILVLFGVVTIVFFISREIMDAEAIIISRLHFPFTEEQFNAMARYLGLDKPIIIQYFIFVKDLFSGNWGVSITIVRNSRVWDIIIQRLPRTLEMAILSMLIAIIIGVKLGKMGAGNRNKVRDISTRVISYITAGLPVFVIGLFLLQFGLNTGVVIFPIFGYKTPGVGNPPTITYSRIIDCIISGRYDILVDYLYHIMIPISAMVLIQLSFIHRHTRSSMISVLQENYIQTARVKGVRRKTILKKHVLKNAAPPVITMVSMNFPRIFAAMIPLEVAFSMPGIGYLFYDSMRRLDYGIFIILIFLFSLVVIIFNFIADISYAILDPRVRLR